MLNCEGSLFYRILLPKIKKGLIVYKKYVKIIREVFESITGNERR